MGEVAKGGSGGRGRRGEGEGTGVGYARIADTHVRYDRLIFIRPCAVRFGRGQWAARRLMGSRRSSDADKGHK